MIERELYLEDALLHGDAARAAGYALSVPLEDRDSAFDPVLDRVALVLPDYPDSVACSLALLRAVCTEDAADAAAELGEPAVTGIDQRVFSLAMSDRLGTWIADVVWHLSEDVLGMTDHRLVLIETLCEDWRLARPTTDTYLFALSSALGAAAEAHGDGALSALLSGDPSMCAVIPGLLASPGAGQVLSSGPWAEAITDAAAAGMIDRSTLIDLVLQHRPAEEPEQMRWFLQLHELLDPSNDEMLARDDAYLRLLADPRPEVVAAVADALYRRDASTPLPIQLLTRMSSTIFESGTPGTIVRHIDWMRSVAERKPEVAGQLAVALREGFTAGEAVRGHCVDAVIAILDLADIDVVEGICEPIARAASTLLPQEAVRVFQALPASARDRYGAMLPSTPAHEPAGRGLDAPTHAEEFTSGPRPAARNGPPHHHARDAAHPDADTATSPARGRRRAPRRRAAVTAGAPLPGPARTLDHLAVLCEEYLHDLDPMLAEYVLDGVAALVGDDLDAARTALVGITTTLEAAADAALAGEPGRWLGERPALALLVGLLLPADHPVQEIGWRAPQGPAGCMTLRAKEILSRVRSGAATALLSLPTEPTGAIDPAALAERVAAFAESSRTAWPLDIEQALLRAHGTQIEADVFARLSRVASPLARTIEHALRQHVPSRPAVRVRLTGERPQVTTTSVQRPTDGPLTRHAFDVRVLPDGSHDGLALAALYTLPHHREVAAAYLLGPLSDRDVRPTVEDLGALGLLGQASGRISVATATSLLFGACLPHEHDRQATVAALSALVNGPGFDLEGTALEWSRALPVEPRLDLAAMAETLRATADTPAGAAAAWELANACAEAATVQVGIRQLAELCAELDPFRRERARLTDTGSLPTQPARPTVPTQRGAGAAL
ncbi:MAG: hypothetical protein ACK5MT_18420 [Actinomycetales bacterium]